MARNTRNARFLVSALRSHASFSYCTVNASANVLPYAAAVRTVQKTQAQRLTSRLFSTAPHGSDINKSPAASAATASTKESSPPATESAVVEVRGSELVLSPPALVVTREYEWGNIIIGFEQANKYTIRAAPHGDVVGYIAEEGSLGQAVVRNVMRRRRPFKATVMDKHGDVVFILRRPMYLVSSTMYVEREDGTPIGEIQMNWHLYRRRYSLYVDKSQFASVDSGFLAMDFDMRDEQGNKIASVNKDWTGFARELFTDANQYVLRLDPSMGVDAPGLVSDPSSVSPTVDVAEESKLTHDQRAVLLATAMSIDFDYFSHHSRMGPMGMGMPMPVPIPGGGGAAGAGAAGAEGAAAAGGLGPDDDGLGPMEGETGGAFAQSTDSQSQGEFAEFDEPDYGFQDQPQDGDGQFAEFEEPDYGFQEAPQDDWGSGDDSTSGWGDDGGDSWGGSGDGWGDAAGDDESSSVGGILGKVWEMFNDD